MKHLGFFLMVAFCLGVDKEVQCQSLQECEHVFEGKLNNKEQLQCSDMVKYLKCIQDATGQEFDVKDVSKRIEEIMTREKIECPDIRSDICISEKEKKICENSFNGTLDVLDLRDRAEVKCRLAEALKRCLEQKGKCKLTLQTIQATLYRLLNSTDCGEYVDLCDHALEESCGITYVKSTKNCENLKVLKECLRTKSSCPQSRIHFTIRKTMKDESFDCSDVSACNEVKEEKCLIDAFDNKVDTKENKCRRFKTFKNCMILAQCNNLYLDSKVAEVDKTLKSPCDGASAILASIGLTLVMAVFTSLWK